MKKQLRSSFSTQGRRMAGARALWAANGMKKNQMGKPIIAIVNSFTQFVPGHVHLHEIGQLVKAEIEKLGCFAAEFNTIAIDDGIAMGHDGMLYSLPSRDIIADSVEYMVNAHKADAMVCISNCDKITPGMLMAAMRLNIPAVFVSGGPMEAGEWNGQHLDLIDAMIKSADESVSDQEVANIEQNACPTCGCCSGMFTANSTNGCIYQTSLCQFVHNGNDTTSTVYILNMIFLCIGSHLAETRSLAGKHVDIIHLEVYLCFVSNGQQVKNRIGRSPHCYIQRHGVQESLTGSDATGKYTFVSFFII